MKDCRRPAGCASQGWTRARVVRIWVIVIAVAAVSAALGYLLLDPASGRNGAFAQGFAAGALLAMITDTMLPESYDVEHTSTGALVAIGFSVSLILRDLTMTPASPTSVTSRGPNDAPCEPR
jgi:zinc transporter, ZIP family